jgi:hypothetical protein
MTVTARMRTGTRLAVTAIPMVIVLGLFLGRTRTVALNGDEPHYLMIADSVARDRDLDLRNNYLRDFETGRIYGVTPPHVYNVRRGWMPYHMPGIGVLLAIPFAVGGVAGARLALIALAGLLPWTLVTWLDRDGSDGPAGWLTIGLTISLPFLFGVIQVYPDLPVGVIATALAVWLLRRTTHYAPGHAWAAFWLVVGALPWLHVKYLGAAIAFAGGGLVIAWRIGRRRGDWRPVWMSPVVLWGVATLGAYQLWAFDRPLGVRGFRELTTSPSRALEILLGLHLDQSQGMFVQHPLLLAGVVALPVFARLRFRFAALWAVLYASLIVPNALELARYGGSGPVGRFGWTAAWLWSIPLGVAAAHYWSEVSRYVKLAVVGALAYQALLAVRWLRTPAVLFPHLDEPRDSLFPDALRGWLPSFYFWDFSSYWRFVPNLVAFGVIMLLLVFGAWGSRSIGSRTRAHG